MGSAQLSPPGPSCPPIESRRVRIARAARRTVAGGVAEDRGAAVIEFAIVGSLLLMMVLGVVELGNVFSAQHTLTSLSREGANLAARGATLGEALGSVVTNGSDMQLAERGGAVVSRIAVRNGSPKVEDQVSSPGYESRSRIGSAGGDAVAPWQLEENQIVYSVEIFYRYDSITPFEGAFGVGVPDTLYEVGIF